MLKKIKERKLHLFILIFLIGFFAGVNLSSFSSAAEPAYKYLDYFHQVFQIIQTEYVDKVDTKNIFYGAIRGLISSLNDPYSRFLDEDAYAELQEETTGKFVGVGIEISVKDGEIVVISPIEDTPAMRAGITSEDVIVKVGDISIKDKNLNDIIKLIRGLPGTKVTLTVMRKGFEDPIEFTMERTPIKVDTVNYGVIEEAEKTGYLKIKVFSSDTSKDIEKALAFFNSKGLDKIIIDLRWNPGGLLDQAIKISEFFLDKGKLIVSTKGKEGMNNDAEYRSNASPAYNGKIVILVNKGSASASEILSGALRDNNRATLVGEKTFGKGSVQKFFNLDENLGLTMTIAKYYTPSGVSIHGKGIMPDIAVSLSEISEEDRKKISKLYKDKLLETFISSHHVYNDETKKQFAQLLKDNNLTLKENDANLMLKTEINKFAKRPLYDLEFDNQLREAISVVKK